MVSAEVVCGSRSSLVWMPTVPASAFCVSESSIRARRGEASPMTAPV